MGHDTLEAERGGEFVAVTRWRPHPVVLAVAAALLGVVGAGSALVYTAVFGPGSKAADPSLQVIHAAPDDDGVWSDGSHAHHHDVDGVSVRGSSFTDLGGGAVSFDDYLGTPVVVNFWQSSCPPCITEMPALEQVHRELDGELVVLGIAVREPVSDSLQMIETTGVTYAMGRDDGTLMAELGAFGMPSSLFVTASGDVLHVATGALTLDEIREHVEYLLR
jgi:thiol-disulfide isomerase/thioredoxin